MWPGLGRVPCQPLFLRFGVHLENGKYSPSRAEKKLSAHFINSEAEVGPCLFNKYL